MTALDIGFVLSSISRNAGGLFTSVRGIAQALHLKGHAVTVYALRDEFSQQDCAAWLPLEPLLFDRLGPRVLAYAPALSAAIGEHDILHQHGIWQFPSIAVSRWRKRTGRPVVVAPRGMIAPWAINHRAWKKKLARRFYEDANIGSAACIQSLARGETTAIRAAGFGNPIAQISNGIELPSNACPVPKNYRRKTLLFLGRLHPKKGVTELLTAWAVLAKSDPDFVARWRLLIAGWGDAEHETALMKQAASLPSEAQIEFCGPLYGENKHGAYNLADAFILPSHSEGQPMAVLEAWAYGTPSFITDECNLSVAFARDAAVRVTTSYADMARVLREKLEDPDLAAMAQRARLLCEENFTCEVVAEQYLATYRWLLGQGGRPPFVSKAG